jgi:alpha-L-rhamnosidase
VLAVTGDDTADVWVNGALVGSSPRVADSWKTAALVDLAGHLTAGANVSATPPSGAGCPARPLLMSADAA